MAPLKDLLIPVLNAKNVEDRLTIRILIKPTQDAGEAMGDSSIDVNMDNGVEVQSDDTFEELWVPRDLICSSSKFFQTATKDVWDALRAEDQKQTVTVTFEPRIFKAYIHWLYFGTIPRTADVDASVTPQSDYVYLAQLYVLGEEIMDTRFKNGILESFVAVLQRPNPKFPGPVVVAILYRGTASGSPIRRMMVEMYSHLSNEAWSFNGLPEEALLDIVKAMAKLRPKMRAEKPWLKIDDYKETDD